MRFSKFRGLASSLVILALAGIMFAGCGDDDGSSKPKVLTIADFAGSWAASQYKVTTKTIPEVSVELISLGGTFTWIADNAGAFTGEATIPAALGGPFDLQYAGTFELVGQDTLQVRFDPEIPPFLTDTRAKFTLVGNTLTLTDDNATFDFDQDGTDEPAKFEGIMVRS